MDQQIDEAASSSSKEGGGEAGKVPLPDCANPPNPNPALNSQQSIVSALFAVAEAHRVVGQLRLCLAQLNALNSARVAGTEGARHCLEMDQRLREERRGHQEELRTINQEMNQLEFMLGPIRQGTVQKRAELEANEVLIEAKVQALEQVEIQAVPATAVDEPSPGPEPLQLLLALHLFFQQQALNASASAMAHPRAAAGANAIPNPQPKMKACQHCQRSIHRNAPTCPYCKQKITSKAAKRARR